MSERTVLKLEIIEHKDDWSGTVTPEYAMEYDEADKERLGALLLAIAQTYCDIATQGGYITRRR